MTLLLNDSDVRSLLDMPRAISVLDEAYTAYGRGEIVNVPWSTFSTPTQVEGLSYRLYDFRAAIPALGISAVGLTSATSKAGGRRTGETCLILLFDHTSSELLAILPDDHIQRLRVGATSALSVKYLANPGAGELALLGSGRQAGVQLEALQCVHTLRHVRVFSPTSNHRVDFAKEWSTRLTLDVIPVASSNDAVSGADLVSSAASAFQPTFDGSTIAPGAHVTSISMSQLDRQCLDRGPLFTSSKGQNVEYSARGEQAPYRGQELLRERWDRVRELESVMAGSDAGRQSDGEITVFFGNGAGLQVAALGHEVLRLAKAKGLGQHLELGMSSQLALGA